MTRSEPNNQGPASVRGPVWFTTREVARLFGVTAQTVANWADRGKLQSERTAGGHRRISAQAVADCALASGRDVPASIAAMLRAHRVVIVDVRRDLGELVADYLHLGAGWDLRVVDSTFRLAFELGRFEPDVVLVDLDLRDVDPLQLPRLLAAAGVDRVRLLAWSSGGEGPPVEQVLRAGFEGVLPRDTALDQWSRHLAATSGRRSTE